MTRGKESHGTDSNVGKGKEFPQKFLKKNSESSALGSQSLKFVLYTMVYGGGGENLIFFQVMK